MPHDTAPPPARSLPLHQPAPVSPGQLRHAITAAVIVLYAAAALTVAVVGEPLPVPRWLAIHLVLLGAATNAVVVWSTHFAEALLHERVTSTRLHATVLGVLNAGVLAVVVGVPLDLAPLVWAGTAAVVGVAAGHGLRLIRMIRRSIAGRLRPAAWFYVGSALSLCVGGAIGGLMGTGTLHTEGLHGAHVHANVFGWLGLAVLGTLLMLWPAALRVQMHESAPARGRRIAWVAGLGLAAEVGGLAGSVRVLAVAGGVAYLAGVLDLVVLGVQTVLVRRPKRALWAAAAPLAAGVAWLAAGVVLDAVAIARTGDGTMEALVPVLIAGFVAQTVTGALVFLLPTVLGRGPAGAKRIIAVLQFGWPVRVAATNLGAVLLMLPLPHPVYVAGWVLAFGGVAALVPAVLTAVVASLGARAEGGFRVDVPDVVAPAAIVAVVAVLALVVGGVLPGAHHTAAPPKGTVYEDVSLAEFTITPSVLTVPPDRPVALRVHNTGTMTHDLRVAGHGGTPMLSPGESATLVLGTVTGPLDGWCSVPGHRAAGMTMRIVPGKSAPSTPGHHTYDATLPPVGPGTVHRVTLPMTEQTVEVAPGVKQREWTFGGTAPGPVLHGHLGDTFVVTIVNRTAMTHSVDFHAGEVAPDPVMRPIPPGGSLVYRFTADHAGIWMYHCGTAPVAEHVAAGMYGAVVIDPPGLPPVAHSYVIVGAEVHLGGPDAVAPLSALSQRPDLMVFNGYANQYVDAPLQVVAGDRVRFWLLDAGPDEPLSFHVVGAQFDRVYKEGAYLLSGGSGGAQALDLQAGEGGFVETQLRYAGHYMFLTHLLVDADHGAMGTIVAR